MSRRYTGGFLSAKEQATDATTANGVFTAQEAGALTATGNFPTGRWTPQRSLRFESEGNAYLNRSFAADGNRKTWTMSWWVKRGKLSSDQHLWSSAGTNHPAGADIAYIGFTGDDRFVTYMYPNGGPAAYYVGTNRLFRDPAAWYNIVVHMNTSLAIQTNRIKIYVNGVQETSLQNTSYPSLDYASSYINSTRPQLIGHEDGRFRYPFDGYMAEFNFIDGQALDASAFGMTDPSTGTWIPKRYTNTYGTNGFYLDFRDVTGATAVALGADRSGNGNNFTPNNMQVSGGDYWNWDQMYDVPGLAINTPGRQNRGNYPLINPAWKGSSITVSQAGQYVYNNTSSDYHNAWFTTVIPPSGKYYWEVTLQGAGDVMGIGIAPTSQANTSQALLGNFVNIAGKTPGFYSNWQGVAAGYFADGAGDYVSVATNDVLNFAYDAATGELWIGKNGTYYARSENNIHKTTSAGTSTASRIVDAQWRAEGMVPYFMAYNGTGTGVRGGIFNFGQKDFRYTPPAGFATLCTTSMPDSIIKRADNHFDVKTWTGNGTSQQIGVVAKQTSAFSTSSLEFKPEQTSYMFRTPAVTGSQTTATYSFWVKRAVISVSHPFHTTKIGSAGTNATVLQFRDNNKLDITFASTADTNYGNQTTSLFTDTSSWYHVVVAVDTTQLSAGNRLKVYVNGVQVTLWSTSNVPPQSATLRLSNSSLPFNIGADPRDATYFNGSISEAYFIDGQALTASSFGQFDANNNWMPQRYTGTYGTNGFYLPLSKPTDTPVMSYGATFTGGAGSSTQLVTSTNANLALGTNNFTVEYWVTRSDIGVTGGQTALTFGTGQDTYAPLFGYSLNNGGLHCYMSSNGSSWDIVSGALVAADSSMTNGQWAHVAITRSGNTFTSYFNGKQTATWTSSASIYQNANSISIGKGQGANGAGNPAWAGMISNVRVVIGSVLYTGNFTPSTTPLTAVTNTRLLTLQDSTIVDNSTNALTFTNTGSVAVSDASPWQRTVGYDASGNNNNLNTVNFNYSVPRSTVLTYGTPGTYTWVAPAGVTSVKALVIAGGGAGGSNGGGGGAGGMIYNAAVSVTPGSSYTVTVGRGGHTRNQGNATNSVFSSLTAIAGGNGATYALVAAQNGGSGGGGSLGTNTPGTGTAGQGNAGGAGNNGNFGNTYYHGGGGGAGGTGFAGGDSRGGPGLVNLITGVPIYYAGGGGSHYFVTNTPYRAAGGIGGGGDSVGDKNGPAAGGRPNSGGGGGGTSSGLGGGPGGSGVVILSYTNAALYDGVGANSIIASDISRDTPTDFEDSTGVSGNYPILNYSNYSISNSNSGNTYNITNAGLTLMSDSSGAHKIVPATMPVSSGKWYFEMILGNDAADAYSAMGLIPFPLPNHDYLTNLPSSTSTTNGFSWQSGPANNFNFWTDYIGGAARFVTINPITASAIGDVMQIAVDIDNNKIWAGRNNVWYDSSGGSTGNPSTGANATSTNVIRYISQYGALVPFCSVGQENMVTANFGQSGFVYTPPTGFKAINSKNLKEVGSNKLPDTFGNFVNTADLVWIKGRSAANHEHMLFDTVRSAANYLSSNSNAASVYNGGTLTAFKPNGFDVGNGAYNNASAQTYVGWSWNRGKTPGFDIVNYAGNGVNGRMIEHNLGQVPAMYITKCLSGYNAAQGFLDWSVYHKSCLTYTTGSTQGKRALWLQSTLPAQAGVGGFYINPSSTQFSPNQINYDNSATQSYIAYLWAEVPGFSRFGSYTGNGSSDGPFVYTGFRPKWVMIKNAGATGNWEIQDTARSAFNPMNAILQPNLTAADATAVRLDGLSNGFKLRSASDDLNTSSGTYIYAAFAETPFKYANAR